MTETLGLIIVAVLAILALLAVASMVRSFLRGMQRIQGTPYVPVPDAAPQPPVLKSGSVQAVGWLCIAWSLAHIVIFIGWALTGRVIGYSGGAIIAALYVLFAAGLTGIGAIMLLESHTFGRRMIAMGEFLMGIASLLGGAAFLMLPPDDSAMGKLYEFRYLIAGAFAVHLILDAIIGTLAQRVGKPADWK